MKNTLIKFSPFMFSLRSLSFAHFLPFLVFYPFFFLFRAVQAPVCDGSARACDWPALGRDGWPLPAQTSAKLHLSPGMWGHILFFSSSSSHCRLSISISHYPNDSKFLAVSFTPVLCIRTLSSLLSHDWLALLHACICSGDRDRPALDGPCACGPMSQ